MQTFINAPAGVKAFLAGCALILLISVACIIYEAIEDSRKEKRRFRRGFSD